MFEVEYFWNDWIKYRIESTPIQHDWRNFDFASSPRFDFTVPKLLVLELRRFKRLK